jgi:hypothetical protein
MPFIRAAPSHLQPVTRLIRRLKEQQKKNQRLIVKTLYHIKSSFDHIPRSFLGHGDPLATMRNAFFTTSARKVIVVPNNIYSSLPLINVTTGGPSWGQKGPSLPAHEETA